MSKLMFNGKPIKQMVLFCNRFIFKVIKIDKLLSALGRFDSRKINKFIFNINVLFGPQFKRLFSCKKKLKFRHGSTLGILNPDTSLEFTFFLFVCC